MDGDNQKNMERNPKHTTYSHTYNHAQRAGEDQKEMKPLDTQNHSTTQTLQAAFQVSGAPFPGGNTHPSAEVHLQMLRLWFPCLELDTSLNIARAQFLHYSISCSFTAEISPRATVSTEAASRNWPISENIPLRIKTASQWKAPGFQEDSDWSWTKVG